MLALDRSSRAQLFDVLKMQKTPEDKGQLSSRSHVLMRLAVSLLLKLMINGVVPILLYILLRRATDSQVLALAMAGTIPMSRIASRMIRKRRIEMIGALATAGFAGALVVSFAANCNPLVLKLYSSVITGAIGMTLLISAIGHRPFVVNTLTRLANENPRLQMVLDKLLPSSDDARTLRIATAIVAVTLLIEATAHAVLVLTVSTATYLVIGRITGWTIRGIGAFVLLWYLRRARIHHPVSPADRGTPAQ